MRTLPRFGLSCTLAAAALLAGWPGTAAEPVVQRAYPLDPAVAPCDDLYGHVCNRVSAAFTLAPTQQAYLFAATDAQLRILRARMSYLQGLAHESWTAGRPGTLRTLYRACMDREAARRDERRYVEALVRRVEGLPDRAALQAFLAQGLTSGDFSFLTFETPVDLWHPDRLDLLIAVAPPTLPEPGYYRQAEVVSDLEVLAEDFFRVLGLDRVAQRARWTVAFEQALAAVYPSPAAQRKLRLSERTVARSQLLRRYPGLRLDGFLKRVPGQTLIREPVPRTLAFLDRVLREWPIAQIKSAYLFAALSELLDDGYPAYREERLAFQRRHLGAAPERPDRRQRCTRWISERFAKELDAELLPRLFPDLDRAPVAALVERVRAALLARLGRNRWLTPAGRRAAQDKIAAVRMQLLAPRTPEEWDFNPPADYREDRPVGNRLLYRRKRAGKRLAELGRPRNRSAWEEGPLTVDAFYSVSENRLVLSQGILQEPYYSSDQPDWMNLGGIGVLVGHELGHAIDDLGSRYDGAGRLHTWLGEVDRAGLHRRMARMLAVLERIGLGELQLGEAVAELVGLTAAYEAAFPGAAPDPAAERAFFIQYARTWCLAIRPGFRERLRRTDPHPLGADRINGLVPQVAGFQRAFRCRAGDALYRSDAQRIQLW